MEKEILFSKEAIAGRVREMGIPVLFGGPHVTFLPGESLEHGDYVLRGEAEDPRDKLVYPTGLKRYVTRRVRDMTANQQRPYVSDHGIDDPIAIVVK